MYERDGSDDHGECPNYEPVDEVVECFLSGDDEGKGEVQQLQIAKSRPHKSRQVESDC